MASWILTLKSYSFWCQAQAPPSAGEFMELECVVSEATGTTHSLSLIYDAANTEILEGYVIDTGAGYEIEINTNSFEFMQQILWAVTLPNNITKTVQITGSPISTIAGYTVDAFALYSSTQEATLAAAEVALPESAAAMPENLRKMLERRRGRQVRLREAGLRR